MSIKVNLGCGDHILPGWQNHDLLVDGTDITEPLPYDDDSVSYILAEHIIEHLDSKGALAMLDSCQRILRPGGVLRISVPALDKILELDGMYEQYLNILLGQEGLSTACRRDSVNLVLTQWEHKTWWNTGLLRAVLWARGFEQIKECHYGESEHEPLANIEGHSTNHWLNIHFPGIADVTKKEVAIMEATK